MMSFDRLFGNGQTGVQPEHASPPTTAENQVEAVHEVETNLYNALRDLEPQLLAMGIYKVGAETEATAKSPIAGLEISISGTINSIDLIGVEFWYQDGRREKKFIVGWKNEQDYLSGPASQETFKDRIKKELGIVDQAPVVESEAPAEGEPLDWSDFGEIGLHILFSNDFLLGDKRFSNLYIRRSSAQALSDGGYEISTKSFPSQVVVEVRYNVLQLGDSVSQDVANALKKQVIDAIEKAHRTKIKQDIFFSP